MSEDRSDRAEAERAPAPLETGQDTDVRLTRLERRTKRQRWWLIALTTVLVITLLVAVPGIMMSLSFMMDGPWNMGSRGPDRSAEIEKLVKDAYGGDLASVKVRRVDVEMDDEEGPPFPLSLMMGSEFGDVYAVEYRIAGAAAPFANAVMDPEEIGMNGFVPVKGSLRSRLTLPQIKALLAAYAQESKKPAGGIVTYTDPEYYMSGEVPATLKVAGKTYPSEELWRVFEGIRAPEGKPLSMKDARSLQDVIVRMDPKTGAVTVLGTEPSEGMNLPF